MPCLLQLPQPSLCPSPALRYGPLGPTGACLPGAHLPRAFGYSAAAGLLALGQHQSQLTPGMGVLH